MKILIATPSLRAEIGGPAYSVGCIDAYLKRAMQDTVTVTRPSHGGRSSYGVWSDLFFGDFDLVHNFGTWTPFNHAVSAKSRRAKIPYVFCPMGMLEPWALAQKHLKKILGWHLYQRRDIEQASVVHATAKSEAENIRALGVKAPIAVIPHGIDIPTVARLASQNQADSGCKTILFLSRIHPKKGLLELVEAFARLRTRDWKVIVAGPDLDGYQAVIEKEVNHLRLQDLFDFVGPVYGEQKSALFDQADLFVLPTHSENFGLVIPEALAHGVPVITTTGAPWAEINENGCGWWIPTGTAALEATLSVAMSLPLSALAEMGARGRLLVETRYGWPAIIQKHVELYEWIIGGGSRPDFILD